MNDEEQNLNYKIEEAFNGYFETYKIKNVNLRQVFETNKSYLSVDGRDCLQCPNDFQRGMVEYKKKYFDIADEGYDDILKDVNLTRLFINLMRDLNADTEEKLQLAEEGLNDIIGTVMKRKDNLKNLRKEILG